MFLSLYIYIHICICVGSIPAEISGLTLLTHLDWSANSITGTYIYIYITIYITPHYIYIYIYIHRKCANDNGGYDHFSGG